MSLRLSAAVATLGLVGSMALPLASQAQTMDMGVGVSNSVFNSGDLIKGSGSTVYYFGGNGRRYVFPNEKTYFTWYTDFSNVVRISDGQLASIPLGGNVTYRPGRKMVKITTDSKVYAVDQGGVLRHVGSEQLANTLYGLSWKSQIDDIPDAFFVNYRVGTPLQTESDFRPADVRNLTANINQDKQFDEHQVTITIGSMQNGFVPNTITVKRGTRITWTNRDITNHTVTGQGWNSGMIAAGQDYSKTFDTVGSYDYHCTIHPSMQGTINVVN
jgi:plastocyanin